MSLDQKIFFTHRMMFSFLGKNYVIVESQELLENVKAVHGIWLPDYLENVIQPEISPLSCSSSIDGYGSFCFYKVYDQFEVPRFIMVLQIEAQTEACAAMPIWHKNPSYKN